VRDDPNNGCKGDYSSLQIFEIYDQFIHKFCLVKNDHNVMTLMRLITSSSFSFFPGVCPSKSFSLCSRSCFSIFTVSTINTTTKHDVNTHLTADRSVHTSPALCPIKPQRWDIFQSSLLPPNSDHAMIHLGGKYNCSNQS